MLDKAIRTLLVHAKCMRMVSGREHELITYSYAMISFLIHKLPTYWLIFRRCHCYVSNMVLNGENKKQKA